MGWLTFVLSSGLPVILGPGVTSYCHTVGVAKPHCGRFLCPYGPVAIFTPSPWSSGQGSPALLSDETKAVPAWPPHRIPQPSRPVLWVFIQQHAPRPFSGHWPPSSSPWHMQFQTWPQKAFESKPWLIPPAIPCLSWSAAAVTQHCGMVLFLHELKPRHLPRIN